MREFLPLVLALALVPIAAPAAHAQDAAAYVVTYIEVLPSARKQAAGLIKKFGEASRKDDGNLRFDVLQRIDRTQHFAMVSAWKDQKAAEAHAAAAATKEFRDKLQPWLSSAYDERPHGGMVIGAAESGRIPGSAVYAVTHVDIIPPKKDDGIAALKELSGPSRQDTGNLRYDVLQQSSRPNHFTLVEAWRSRKALEGHEAAAHTRKFRDLLLPMSGSLYDQRLYKAM